MSKGAYIGIDSVARKVKSGYVGIEGLAHKIKKAYIGVDGVAKLCWASVDPVFANNSWADIIAACQANSVPDEWAVGDSKTMTIGGTDYQIDIIGKSHDTYSDGSGIAPLTFQMHDCYGTKYAMNLTNNTNNGGWSDCGMRITNLPAILALMPSEVKSGIKTVDKKTNRQVSWNNSLITTADKLFLLSVIEVSGSENGSLTGEGKQYAYYKEGNSVIKTVDGTDTAWFLRSYPNGNGVQFKSVWANGSIDTYPASTSLGVAFAFCF